jgi:heat shock protein HspQ
MDESGEPVSHPQVGDFFAGRQDGRYIIRETYAN